MLNIRQQIAFDLRTILKNLALPDQDFTFSIEHPKDESHGDYSTNIAMALWANQEPKIKNSHFVRLWRTSRGRQEWRGPLELAQKIADSIIHNSQFMIHFDKVEAVKPGFINFYISQDYLTALMIYIIKVSDEYGCSKNLENKKIMVEFTDPNPFKEFHIGHLYSNTVGESISRLLEGLGGDVKRANYQGDVGMHVAKAIYGIFHLCHAEFSSASQILENKILNSSKRTFLSGGGAVQDDSLNKRVKFLGEAYVLGAKVYEEDEKAKREIEELNKKIYDKDPAITALYEKGRQWSLEYFEELYKRLGTKFDYYYFESEVGKEGLELVKEYLKKGVFEKSEGAVIFPGEKHARLPDRQGLHNRVFINSLGLPTYEAKELGLALRKYRDFNYDQSIVITGNEITGYFKVLLAALEKINPDLAAKTKHLPHGMVRLPTGKMSSRSGNVLTGEWLLDEAKKLLKSKYSEMEEETLEKVAVGSVKYALLKSSIGHNIEFDFEESINIQGNSGPYLQYTFARTQSVLAKVKENEISFVRGGLAKLEPLEPEEVSLLRALTRFPEVVEEAGRKFSPNLLCNYLFDLAQKFNLFYQKHKILQSRVLSRTRQSRTEDFRLALTQGVGQIIKNGLYLLGIKAPEQM